MIIRNHTGLVKWPLVASSGGGINPTWNQADEVRFSFQDLPAMIDGMPAYCPAVELELSGSVTNNDSSASNVFWDTFLRMLLSNVRLENCWHGTPLLDTHWLGSIMDGLEFLWNGYNYWGARGHLEIALASSAFVRTVLLPLSWGHGEKPHHTSQLALFYKNGQLLVRTAAASVGTGLSTGISFSSLRMRATALLLPEPEIRLGPGVQHVTYQDTLSANQTVVNLDSFGNRHGLDGAELGAGIASLMYLTSTDGQPGGTTGDTLTDFGFAARGQKRVQALRSFIHELRDAIGGRPARVRQNTDVHSSDMNGYPWRDDAQQAGGITLHGDALNSRLRVFPMGIVPHKEQEVTKLQTFEGSQTFEILHSGGSGNHVVAATQFHSWTPQKMADAIREIANFEGGRMLRAVFGQNVSASSLKWRPKVTRKNAGIDARKARFLPLKLEAGAAA